MKEGQIERELARNIETKHVSCGVHVCMRACTWSWWKISLWNPKEKTNRMLQKFGAWVDDRQKEQTWNSTSKWCYPSISFRFTQGSVQLCRLLPHHGYHWTGWFFTQQKPSQRTLPVPMEMLDVNNGAGQAYGYTLYRTKVPGNTQKVRVSNTQDWGLVSHWLACIV